MSSYSNADIAKMNAISP